jgi:hypothetical protein
MLTKSIWAQKTDSSGGIFTKYEKQEKTHVVNGKFKDKEKL